VKFWDESNFEPAYRDGMFSANYQQHGGLLSGLMNATTNPNTTIGNAMTAGEVLPDTIRAYGSGETQSLGEAYRRAQAERLANNAYQLGTPVQTADLPSSADAVERTKRIEQLQKEVQAAAVPEADQRWARWTGKNLGTSFVPPGWVTSGIDTAIGMLDPTILLPVGGVTADVAKTVAKGGPGMTRSLLSGLAARSKDFGWDAATEQAVSGPIAGVAGGQPGRTWTQFGIGNSNPEQKSEQQVEESRGAAASIFDRLKDNDEMARSQSKAYGGLGVRANVPYPYR
jgi:hypothetical protein